MAQRPALAVPVTGLTEDRRRVLMRADRVIEPVGLRQRVAEIVERPALAVPVTGLTEDRRRVPVRADRVIEPVRLRQRDTEIVQRHALGVPVTGLTEDRRRVLVGGDRLLEPAHLHQRGAEVDERHGFIRAILETAGGIPADRDDGQPVVKVPAPGQVAAQLQRQPHRDAVPAGTVRQGDGRDQAGPIIIQPLQSSGAAAESRWHRRVWQRPQMASRRARGRQVVVKQPVRGLFPPVRVGAGIRQPPGLQARQVIHPPPVRRT